MSLLKDIKELKTGPRELRNFGLLVGGVFLALGAWWWFRGKPFYPWGLVPGVGLFVPGLLFPRVLKWPYLGWMGAAMVLGVCISTLLLLLLFYFVFTPLALVARLTGRDFLNRRLHSDSPSYWRLRDPGAPASPRRYEQQY